MSPRELIVLGTASQVPTRRRNHNAYFLRWDDEGLLFDPGEGTQRQCIYAGVAASSITRIFITHFHGDHCLGFASMVQRLSLDGCPHPVKVYYPASGQVFIERMRHASIYRPNVTLELCPIDDEKPGLTLIDETPELQLFSCPLEHGVPTLGYRLVERTRRVFVPERLEALGLKGKVVGELDRQGRVEHGGRVVTIDEVTQLRGGASFAFVMDTRPCAGAVSLARDVDLLVMEATYASDGAELAASHGHSTAAEAARVAIDAGAATLAITHFSQRYTDDVAHLREAREVFPSTIALRDLDRVDVPRRR